jgi:hypothetical protein
MEVDEMKLLTQDELKKLSFPDAVVEDMVINIPNKKLKIKTNGGFLSINRGIELDSCRIIVENWLSIRATVYHAQTKKFENFDEDIDKLIDICEFEYGEEIIFRGFGAKGGWIEIVLSKAFMKVEYD